MKKLIIFLLFLALTGNKVNAQWQQTYPLSNSDKTAIVKNGNTKSMLSYCSVSFYIGNDGSNKNRAFFQWDLSDNIIPDGSTIKSARLYITGITNNDNVQLDARLYSVRMDLNEATADSLWARTDWFNNRTDYYITYASSQLGVIDQSYNEGSTFTDALQTALADDYFTLGIIDVREVTHTYDFNLSNCNVNLEIEYETPNVVIDQKRSDNITSVGVVGKWENSSWAYYAVPDTIPFVNNESLVLLGMQSKVSGPDEKYNNWNNLTDVHNYHTFNISSASKRFTSHFERIDGTIIIENMLISSGANYAGSIYFSDPWLYDSLDSNYGNVKRNRGMDAPFKSRQSPFNPDYTTSYNGDVYQGVFLGQGYDGNTQTWNPPYYSVKAQYSTSSSAHGETVHYYFDRWGGSNVQYQYPENLETPVVFTAADAVAEARFKGHLASNTSAATGPNGSRVLVRARKYYTTFPGHDGSPVYTMYMAYADAGDVWFCYSEDNGETWKTGDEERDQRVSDGSGQNYNPSIATLDRIAYIVWAEKTGADWYIRYRTYDRSTLHWGATETVASFSSSTTPTPQIALTENPLRVMVASNINGYVKTWLRKNGAWQYAGLNTGGSQPAICARQPYQEDPEQDYPFDDIALVYTHNNDIYLRIWDSAAESWSSAKKVSVQNIYSMDNQHASVDYSSGVARIAWQAMNDVTGSYCIYERHWNSGTNSFSSQTTVIESADDSYNPSVTQNSTNNNTASSVVAYQNNGTVYKAEDGQRITVGSGDYPCVTPHYTQALVYNAYNTPPYLIKHTYEEPQGNVAFKSAYETGNSAVNLEASRRLLYRFGNASLGLDISDLSFEGRDISLRADNRSDTLRAVSSGELSMKITAYQQNDIPAETANTPLFDVYFVSGEKETLLRSFRLSDLRPTVTDKRESGMHHLLLSSDRGRNGYFRIGFGTHKPQQYTVLRAGSDAALAKGGAQADMQAALPRRYSLEQNYPNPFNPITHIRFALPESGNVALTVYDMAGRAVAVLVNGYKSAGRYDVTFDAGGLASGAYIYRLQAGTFTQTRKLLLLK